MILFDLPSTMAFSTRAWLGVKALPADSPSGSAARELLASPATADLATVARDRMIDTARAALPELLEGPIAEFVRKRAVELVEDHARLRAAAGSASRVSVEPVIPPDVIGLFVLVPGEV